MKASYVDSLLLYPRNRYEVKASLNSEENLEVSEIEISLSKLMMEIQKIIISLLHTWLQILEKELYKKELNEEVFKIESIFNDTFRTSLRNELGIEFYELGIKANQAIEDIRLLRNLLTLLYSNDATFFYMTYWGVKDSIESNYSIFKFCDQETSDLFDKLEKYSKERMYIIEPIAEEDKKTRKVKGSVIYKTQNSKSLI